MDWTKFWEEAYRIARAAAQVAAGFFGATAIGVQGAKPITDSVLLDAVIGTVLTAFAVGASRTNAGKTAIPYVEVKKMVSGVGNLPSAFLLAVLLTFGATTALSGIGLTGCGIGQRVRTNVSVPGLVYVLPSIEEDAKAGVQAAPAEEQESLSSDLAAFCDAIRSKDRGRIASEACSRWHLVKTMALRGLDAQVRDGTLSTEASHLGREQIDQCEGMLNQLALP